MQASNPSGPGPASAAVERGHADPATRARRADGRDRERRRPARRWSAGRAPAQQRRQLDHRLHGHPVHRLDRPDPGHGQQRLSDLGDRHRPDQRHQPTRSRSRRPTRSGPGQRRRASSAVTPEDTIFDFPTPAHVDSGDGRGRARRQVHRRRRRARSPASASTRPPPTPARTSAACGRPPATARAGHVHRRDRLRLADRSVLNPRHDHRRDHVRRRLPRPERPLLRHQPTASPTPSTTHRCTRSPTARAPTASTPTAPRSTFPTNTYNATNYWVDVLFTPDAHRARPADERDGDGAGWVGDRHLVGTDHGRSAGAATRSRRTSVDAADRDDGHGHAAGDEHDRDRADGGTAYTFTVQASNPSGPGRPRRSPTRSHRRRATRTVRADRGDRQPGHQPGAGQLDARRRATAAARSPATR